MLPKGGYAQVPTGTATDSVGPIISAAGDTIQRKFYNRLPYFTVGDDYSAPQPLDTTLNGKQYYEPGQQSDFRYRNLGNLGLAHIPITLIPKQDVLFDLGLNQYDLYMFQRQSIRWYTLDQPFTNLFLLIGGNREQAARVTHNQNIGGAFNFAFNFNRFASPGAYTSQETSHNNLGLTTRYEAPTGKYGIQAMLLFNSIRVQDNGGSQGTNIFTDSTFTTAGLIAVELERAQTFVRDFQVVIRQELRQGQSITYQYDDTTRAQKFFPDWVVYHELQLKNYRYEFTDLNPQADYYGEFFLDLDSLEFNVRQKQWGNRLGVQYGSILSADSSGPKYRIFLVDGYIVQHLFDIKNGRVG
jgi:hypothetical protein